MIINVYVRSHAKYQLLLSEFNEIEFCGQIFGKKNSNFMKISPVGAELFHTVGWTHMNKLI
jgi:ATP adenylyltransferase/5',5'''-P-1,P-4-tetraphosphate phosphorylase II